MSSPVPQPSLSPLGVSTTEVLLIRHGQSASVVPGTPESGDPPLSELGRSQATRLAQRLERKQLTAVYASPLRRAVATADALAEPRGLEVLIREELREVGLGDWENGGFRQRALDQSPEFLAFLDAGRWDAIPGAECDEDLRLRATTVVDDIIGGHDGGSVAVVCHGGFIQGYLCGALGIARSIWAHIENTSITLVHAEREHRIIVTVGDCNHLYDPAVAAPPVG